MKISVSHSKDVMPTPLDIATIESALVNDAYSMKITAAGKIKTLSFINEKHASCKQYSISYDTTTNLASFVFSRMTNLSFPEAGDKEKHVKVAMSEWNMQPDVKKYFNTNSYIKRSETAVTGLRRKYRKYQLIVL